MTGSESAYPTLPLNNNPSLHAQHHPHHINEWEETYIFLPVEQAALAMSPVIQEFFMICYLNPTRYD